MGPLILIPIRTWRALRDRLGLRPSFERWLETRTCSDVATGEMVGALHADFSDYMRRRGAPLDGDFRSRFKDLGHPVITDLAGRVVVGRIRLRHRQPRGVRAPGGHIPASAPLLVGTFAVPGDHR